MSVFGPILGGYLSDPQLIRPLIKRYPILREVNLIVTNHH